MSLPKSPPINFLEAYYENCAERELYNDTVLSQSEYWEIWTKMTEHEESRK
tara:strand:- start:494 stop:646 length:153 start_codon:yes stop_codon:yes gene_type:complete